MTESSTFQFVFIYLPQLNDFIWLPTDQRVKQGSSSPTWFRMNNPWPDLQYLDYGVTGRYGQSQLTQIRWGKVEMLKKVRNAFRVNITGWGRWELYYDIKMTTDYQGKDTRNLCRWEHTVGKLCIHRQAVWELRSVVNVLPRWFTWTEQVIGSHCSLGGRDRFLLHGSSVSLWRRYLPL